MRYFFSIILMIFLISCGEGGVDNEKPGNVENLFGEAVLNPLGMTPLAAEIPFYPEDAGSISLKIPHADENEPDFEVEINFEATKDVLHIPVIGLFPDRDNKVVFTVKNSEGEIKGTHEIAITTDPLPAGMPEIEAEGIHDSSEFTFVHWMRTPLAEATAHMLLIDHAGYIRWYTTTDYLFHPTEIFDGILYAGTQRKSLAKISWLGEVLEEWDLSKHGFINIHHDIFRKPDGNFLLTSDKKGSRFMEDHIIEINPEDNTLVNEWDLADIMPTVADLFIDTPMTQGAVESDQEGHQYFGQTNDPIHLNGVWYDDSDDTIIFSSQRSGIAKMYYDGRLKWFMTFHMLRYIDDHDGDGVSDSLAEGYDGENMLTWAGDFRGDNYTILRKPLNIPVAHDYGGMDWDYGNFLLVPVDTEGEKIKDEDVVLGFKDGDDFAWPFRPHSPVILENGEIALFDNGLTRNFSIPPWTKNSFSRAVAFSVKEDETTGYGGKVRQTWEFICPPEDENADPWEGLSVAVSDIDELPNGNRLVTSGAIGSSFLDILNEYDGYRGSIIWEVDPADNTVIHKLALRRVITDEFPPTEQSSYRAERVNPYEGVDGNL